MSFAVNIRRNPSNLLHLVSALLSADIIIPAPLIIHGQSMNGLRRSFLCRIKKLKSQKSSSLSSDPPTSEINCNNSESVIKLLQSTEECIPYQYAVLHCTGFIRYALLRIALELFIFCVAEI